MVAIVLLSPGTCVVFTILGSLALSCTLFRSLQSGISDLKGLPTGFLFANLVLLGRPNFFPGDSPFLIRASITGAVWAILRYGHAESRMDSLYFPSSSEPGRCSYPRVRRDAMGRRCRLPVTPPLTCLYPHGGNAYCSLPFYFPELAIPPYDKTEAWKGFYHFTVVRPDHHWLYHTAGKHSRVTMRRKPYSCDHSLHLGWTVRNSLTLQAILERREELAASRSSTPLSLLTCSLKVSFCWRSKRMISSLWRALADTKSRTSSILASIVAVVSIRPDILRRKMSALA